MLKLETFGNMYDSSGNSYVMTNILKHSGFYMLGAFAIVYLVVFFVFGIRSETLFDLVIFSTLIGFGIYKYFSAADQKHVIHQGSQEIIDFLEDPYALFTSVIFIICFYCLVFVFRIPTNESAPISVMLMGFGGWGLIVFLIVHNALKYLFNVNLLVLMRDPKWVDVVDTSGNTTKLVESKKPEVFNISNNLYTYDDSQAICRAYDSRLATYDEIETAYNNGAEWCNYGWSENQMAFFPTQKKTWQELQVSEKHKNNCGRPGVNGGYFANKNIKFGVNCFGLKPKAKDNDVFTKTLVPFPQTEKNEELEKKVKYWKTNLDKTLQVSSFNKEQWSRY